MKRVLSCGWRLTAALLILSLSLGGPDAEAAPLADPAAPEAAAMVLAPIGQFGGGVMSVAVQGLTAYVGRGPRLEIYNASTPASITLLGRSDWMPGLALGVVVSGNYAYVAAGKAGLRVFNIANPAAPVQTAAIPVYEQAVDLKLHNGLLWVAGSGAGGGLYIYTLGNPANPQLHDAYYGPPVYGLDIANNVAYLAIGAPGVRLLNVTDPTNWSIITTVDTPTFARDVVVRNTQAYVADHTGGLRVLDVSVPASAYDVTGAAIGEATMVTTAGSHLYVGLDSGGVQTFSLSNPLSPTVTAHTPLLGVTLDVTPDGTGRLYAASREGGLAILSLANPAMPGILGQGGPTEHTRGVAIGNTFFGSIAHLANFKAGVGQVGVANPAAPSLFSRIATSGRPVNMTVSGVRSYVVSQVIGLHVFNIANPASLTLLSELDSGGADDIVVQGSYAYQAVGALGLRVLSLTVPSTPTVAATFNTPDWASAVVVSGTLAYVADRNGGLQVINVANPASPTLHKSLDAGLAPVGVDVRGTHAFLADGYNGLKVVNTAATPMTIVGSVQTPGFAEWVAIKDEFAYVADGTHGVAVINISNPAQPTLVGQYPTPGYAYKLTLHQNQVYVADGSGGLFIFNQLNQRVYLPLLRK